MPRILIPGYFYLQEEFFMQGKVLYFFIGIAGAVFTLLGLWLLLRTRKFKMTQHQKIVFLTTSGVLAAIASILRYIEMPIPLMPPFLKVDLSDIPALIGGFALGPWAGAAILLIKNLIYLPVTQTGGVGEIADFVVSLALVLPAALVYRKASKRSGAVWGMALGVALMSFLAGPLMNYYVLIPLYSKFMPLQQIFDVAGAVGTGIHDMWTYILYAVVPFNLFKSAVVCAITYLLYKPLSPILHKYR
jgi:riboflavin transporter FmnP